MEKYVPLIALAVAVLTFIFTQFKTRGHAELAERVAKQESRLDLMVQFFLKGAVLDFHSPAERHKAADGVIERLVQGEELQPEEIDLLVDRIKDEAHHAEDKARRLKATVTLALLDEFIESVASRKSSDVLRDL